MKTEILMNGSMVKNHISFKTGFGYNAIRTTSFLLRYQACQVRPLDLHQLEDTYETGESFLIIFFILTFFTYSKKGKMHKSINCHT